MSETTKSADAAKKAQEDSVRAGQATVDAAAKTTKASIHETEQLAQHASSRARQAGEQMTDTVSEATNAATNVSAKAAEQGRETMLMGLRTAADMGGRVADINFGRSHQMVSSAAHAMDIYRDASERSAERVQALFASCMRMGRGIQQMQQAWLEMVDHTIENAAHRPQDLLRAKSLVEVAQVQRDLYLDAVNHAFESTTKLLDLAGRTVQEAARPLQSHHH